jgi:hypothetical protein
VAFIQLSIDKCSYYNNKSRQPDLYLMLLCKGR